MAPLCQNRHPPDLKSGTYPNSAENCWTRSNASRSKEKDAHKAIEAEGCGLVEVPAAEHAAFAPAVKPLLDEARGTFGGELFRLDEKTAAISFRQSAPRLFSCEISISYTKASGRSAPS
jgi:hypothetical protein